MVEWRNLKIRQDTRSSSSTSTFSSSSIPSPTLTSPSSEITTSVPNAITTSSSSSSATSATNTATTVSNPTNQNPTSTTITSQSPAVTFSTTSVTMPATSVDFITTTVLPPEETSGPFSTPSMTLSGSITLPISNLTPSIILGTPSITPTFPSTTTSSSTESPSSTPSSQFLANKSAVAATLSVVGILLLTALGLMLYWLRKKIVEKRLEERWNELGSVRSSAVGGVTSPPWGGSRPEFAPPTAYGVNRTPSGRVRRKAPEHDDLLGMTQTGRRVTYHDAPSSEVVYAPAPRLFTSSSGVYEESIAGGSTSGAAGANAAQARRGGLRTSDVGSPRIRAPSVTFEDPVSERAVSPGNSIRAAHTGIYSPTTALSNPNSAGYLMRTYRNVQ